LSEGLVAILGGDIHVGDPPPSHLDDELKLVLVISGDYLKKQFPHGIVPSDNAVRRYFEFF
jgi:hypothetical protein